MATKAKRQPLTQDRQVRALKPEQAPYEHAIKDCKGLRVRVYPSGRKSWLYRYRERGTGVLQRLVIGEYKAGGMSLADARAEADRQRRIADEHGSARQFRDAARAENRAVLAEKVAASERDAFTVEKLVTAYLNDVSRKLKTWREVDRALRKYVVPDLGDKPVHAVTRSEVIAVLDKLSKAGKRVQANRVLAYFRRCCNWAIAHEHLAANPCAMVERNIERPKERAFSDAEVRRFLTNLPSSGIDEAIADLFRLILLTGLRPGEAAGLAFNDVDEDGKTIRLLETKNGRTHTVPASPQVMAIIKRRKKVAGSPFVFPAPRDKRRPIRPDALSKPIRDSIESLKVLPFTPHDLRRSFATGLARLGAPRLLISLALNHSVGGVTGIYDRHGYEKELRDWLTRWAGHVKRLGDIGATQIGRAA